MRARFASRGRRRRTSIEAKRVTQAVLGIIGGSGLYDLPGLEDVEERIVTTPWGEPSDAL